MNDILRMDLIQFSPVGQTYCEQEGPCLNPGAFQFPLECG